MAVVFTTGTLILAALVVLRAETDMWAVLATFILAIAMMVTSIVGGSWAGAWVRDRSGLRQRHTNGRWPTGGALLAFLLVFPLLFLIIV